MKRNIGNVIITADLIWLFAFLFIKINLPFSWLLFILFMILGSCLKNAPEPIKIKKSTIKKLNTYFNERSQLIYNENIHFDCSDSASFSLNHVDVYYKEDKVCTLDEFGEYFPQEYQQMVEQLLPFTNQPIQSEMQKEEPVHILADFTNRINEYNIDVEDETISNDLYKTTALLKHLDLLQGEYPKVSTKLNKLVEYYLPILCDILENYTRLSHTHKESEELKQLETKLRKSVLLINEAIKNITVSLFEEEKMNLSADMSVLEALLKKDGLIEDENLEAFQPMKE